MPKQNATSRLLAEDLVSLTHAAKEVAALVGHRVDHSTCYRWCLRGVGGVTLEHVRIGGRIFTSKQALTRFVQERSS